jgi:Short-chain dehydrogenases of various substrate specificities
MKAHPASEASMDLGISGRTAIVCGASKGLGKGCAMALARDGVRVVLNACDPAVLQATAQEIRAVTGTEVVPLAADVTTPAGRNALLAAAPDPDILVTNAAGPPPGDFRQWSEEDWHRAVENNIVAPIMLIKAVIDGMIARRFGRIVNITSAAVKAPYPGLGLSNGARAGLTGFVAGLARQVVRHGVTVNNLLPGSHETDRLRALVRPRCRGQGRAVRNRPGQAKAEEVGQAASAPSKNSAPPAPSSAAPTPATSPARTCSSTAATIRARYDSCSRRSEQHAHAALDVLHVVPAALESAAPARGHKVERESAVR